MNKIIFLISLLITFQTYAQNDSMIIKALQNINKTKSISSSQKIDFKIYDKNYDFIKVKNFIKNNSYVFVQKYFFYLTNKKLIKLYSYALATSLDNNQYVDLLNIISKNYSNKKAQLSEKIIVNLYFPSFNKKNIITLNYKDSKIQGILKFLTGYYQQSKNSKMLTYLRKIKSGENFKQTIARKADGYFDNFNTFPVLKNKDYIDAVKIMALVITNSEYNKLFKNVLREFSESKKHNNPEELKIYNRINTILSLKKRIVSKKIALRSFDSHLLNKKTRINIMQNTKDLEVFINSLYSSRFILIDLLEKQNNKQIIEKGIDQLFLTIDSNNEKQQYLSLLKSKNAYVREYAYQRKANGWYQNSQTSDLAKE